MLTGAEPHAELVRGLDVYLTTVVDHGMNASTFAARVIISTGSDFVSAVTGAVGALKGPLHGGAPGPALDMVFEIGAAVARRAVLREKLARGERLMGFGHRVYKVRDPRADVLAAAAARMFARAGDRASTSSRAPSRRRRCALLEEHKPGRRLKTNVEFYTALLLHGLGLETAFFTPTFAVGRVAGWTAHCFEQRARRAPDPAAERLRRPPAALELDFHPEAQQRKAAEVGACAVVRNVGAESLAEVVTHRPGATRCRYRIRRLRSRHE